jgi:hypothetical protein
MSKIPTNQEIYDAAVKEAPPITPSKTIALNAMFALRRYFEVKLKKRNPKCENCTCGNKD